MRMEAPGADTGRQTEPNAIQGDRVAILVQRSRRPRRWAGVATFAVLLLVVWWTEHDAAPVEPLPPLLATAEAASHPPAPVLLSGLGPSFSTEPLAALPEPHED